MDNIREVIARAIYEDMPYDGKGEKPAWVPLGNSFKQDEARCKADAILSALDAAGMKCVPKEPTDDAAMRGVSALRDTCGDMFQHARAKAIYRAMIAVEDE